MKKTEVVQPLAMASAFAEGVYSSVGTQDFEIPANTSTTSDDTCVIDDGFLPITSTDLDDGGKAPERKNFNGMFYLSTDQRFYLQNGGFITYDSTVATAIGGYPKDAILAFIDTFGVYKLVKSLIDDNTNNFILNEALIDGVHWEEIQMGGGTRNIGEIVTSSIPLSDSNLHLLDGGKLLEGSYAAFIKYISDIYNASIEYSDIFSKVGSPTISSAGIASGFTTSNYLYKNNAVTIGSDGIFEIDLANITISDTTDFQYVLNLVNSNSYRNGEIVLRKSIANGGWQILFFGASNALLAILNFSRTDIISCKLGYDGTKYYATINGTTLDETTATKLTSGTYNLYIGVRNNAGTPTQALTNGTVDLKQIAISINGVTTFDSSKSLDCFTDEATWQATKTAYGVCGKFVYDRVHNSVRLPKIKGFIEGTDTTTTLGDVVEAGLPNITGQLDNDMAYAPSPTGAFENVEGGNHYGAAIASSYPTSLGFDASLSSSIYGNSTTVQPQSVKVLYYIVIATETKTDIKVDIDQIATDLNGKADIDFTNVNNLGTAKSAGWAMPSYRSKDMMPYLQSTGGTYTADANGYVFVSATATAAGQHVGVACNRVSNGQHAMTAPQIMPVFVPVVKNSQYTVTYSATITRFEFIYAEGEQ